MFTEDQKNKAVNEAVAMMKTGFDRGLKEGAFSHPCFMVVAHLGRDGEVHDQPSIHLIPGAAFAKEGLSRDEFMDMVEEVSDRMQGYAIVMGAYNFEGKLPKLPAKEQREWLKTMPKEITDWPKNLLKEMVMISIERPGNRKVMKAQIFRSKNDDIERIGRWEKCDGDLLVGRSYSVLSANRNN